MEKNDNTMENKNIRNIILVLTFNGMLLMTGFGIIFPILPVFLGGIGGSSFDLGVLSAAYSLTAAIFAPIAGRFIDRIGRKVVILISMTGFGFSNLLYLIAQTTIDLMIIRAVEGVFVAGLLPATLALITDITPPEERGKWFGIFYTGFYAGLILGPLLGGISFQLFGLLSAFILSALLAFASGIITYIVLKEAKQEKEKSKEQTPSIINIFRSKTSAWSLGFFILIWINFFLAFGWLFVEPGVVFYLYEELGKSPIDFGLVVAIYAGTLIFGQAFTGRLADKYSKHALILIGLVMYALGFFLLALNLSYEVFLVFAFLAGFSFSIINPALTSLITSMTSTNNRGILLGISSSFVNLSGVFGPILGGYLYTTLSITSSPTEALSSLFYISIFGVIFSLFLVLLRYYLTTSKPKTSLSASMSNAEILKRGPVEIPMKHSININIKRIWNELTTIAMNDGVITQEEESLLNKIMEDLSLYSQLLEKALEDDIITKDETAILLKSRDKLWIDANQVANEDAFISADEDNILQKLKNIINELELSEKDFWKQYA